MTFNPPYPYCQQAVHECSINFPLRTPSHDPNYFNHPSPSLYTVSFKVFFYLVIHLRIHTIDLLSFMMILCQDVTSLITFLFFLFFSSFHENFSLIDVVVQWIHFFECPQFLGVWCTYISLRYHNRLLALKHSKNIWWRWKWDDIQLKSIYMTVCKKNMFLTGTWILSIPDMTFAVSLFWLPLKFKYDATRRKEITGTDSISRRNPTWT